MKYFGFKMVNGHETETLPQPLVGRDSCNASFLLSPSIHHWNGYPCMGGTANNMPSLIFRERVEGAHKILYNVSCAKILDTLALQVHQNVSLFLSGNMQMNGQLAKHLQNITNCDYKRWAY